MRGAVGVCSWSLRPESPADLVDKVVRTGCGALQLALDPIRTGAWDEQETFDRLGDAGITVRSGMFAPEGEDYSSIASIARTGGLRPDSTWEANARAADGLAALCGRRGIGLITFHAGFLPHEGGERGRMIERLRTVAAAFAAGGARVGLETGQEDAATLLGVLDELADLRAGVNFDPANMLLYGSGAPIAALDRLADRVVQVHIKDALASGVAGEWGREVPAGHGGVGWEEFFGIVSARLRGVDLMIEREAGENRIEDARLARELIEHHLGRSDLGRSGLGRSGPGRTGLGGGGRA